MRIEPALWRALFRKRVPRNGQFEDYSERPLASDSKTLPKDALGIAGERFIFGVVQNKPNCDVVACNVANYYCELDVIYLDHIKREIVFVEVKTRRRENETFSTFDAVDAKRRKKMALAARQFVSERGYVDYRRRFDVAVVIWPENGVPEYSIYENAFREGDAIREYRATDYGKTRNNENVQR